MYQACLLVNIPSSSPPLRPNTNSNLPFFSTFPLENFPRVPCSTPLSLCFLREKFLPGCLHRFRRGSARAGEERATRCQQEMKGMEAKTSCRLVAVVVLVFPVRTSLVRRPSLLRSLFCNGYNFLLSHIAFHFPRSTSSFSSLGSSARGDEGSREQGQPRGEEERRSDGGMQGRILS